MGGRMTLDLSSKTTRNEFREILVEYEYQQKREEGRVS